MSNSSLLSNEASLSSFDSLDSFSNFIKIKPYNFEPTVSDNENTDREISSSTIQTNEAEKERKGNLDQCLCGKCKTMSTMLRVCAAVRKINSRMKFLMVTFFISDYLI